MSGTSINTGKRLYRSFERETQPSYRADNLIFAYYAAFMRVFSPDMLYQLWLTFIHYQIAEANDVKVKTMPITVVSDLLQSGLCSEVAFELYEMQGDVADYLKNDIAQLLHGKNIVRVYGQADIYEFAFSCTGRTSKQLLDKADLFGTYNWGSFFEPVTNK